MRSRWNQAHAATLKDKLELRAYSSRLLGSDPALVLHGGGNTSLKLTERGREILCVKGSGADLAKVVATDFARLDLKRVLALLEEDDLDNQTMHARLAACQLEPGPKPSIETLLHAGLPYAYVEHTHADSLLALINTDDGARIAQELYGDLAPIVPFVHSGFGLAKAAIQVFRTQATKSTRGLILLHHGLFAFGHSARASYDNMLKLVERAERYLQSRRAWHLPRQPAVPDTPADALAIAELRNQISRVAGYPLLLRQQRDPIGVAFASRGDLAELLDQGPATPQHAVFAKRVPLIGRDVQAYARRYRSYLRANCPAGMVPAIDAAPRVVVDPPLGVLIAAINPDYLRITWEIFRHDMEIQIRAQGHDRYQGLPSAAILEAEIHYGGFEHRLRVEHPEQAAYLGHVLVTDAASLGANHVLIRARLRGGGAVAVLTTPTQRATLRLPRGAIAIEVQNRRQTSYAAAMVEIVRRYGGIDQVMESAPDQPLAQAGAPYLALSPIVAKPARRH